MDEETRKLVKGGFFNLLLNKALSTLYGEEVNTDFSDSLRLLQVPDLVKFWGTLMETGVAGVIGSTPAGSLVFGDSPRLTDFVRQLMMPFTAPEEQKGQEWENTATMFLSIMSGGSNFFKAKYALEKGKAKSSSGVITDSSVNSMEAILKSAGFITEDEAAHYAFNERSYKLSEDYKKDISEFFTEFSKHLSVEGIGNDETEYWLRMMQQAQIVWGNDPFYMKEIVSQLGYRHTRGDHSYFDAILRLSGYVDEASLKSLISSGPMKPEEKVELTKMIETIKGAQ